MSFGKISNFTILKYFFGLVFFLGLAWFASEAQADSLTGPCGNFSGETILPGGSLQQAVGSNISSSADIISLGQTVNIGWDSHDAFACWNNTPCNGMVNQFTGACNNITPTFFETFPQPYKQEYKQTCVQADGVGGSYSTTACLEVTVNWSYSGTCGCAVGKSADIAPSGSALCNVGAASAVNYAPSAMVCDKFGCSMAPGSWNWTCGTDGIGQVKRTCNGTTESAPAYGDRGVCGCANGGTFTSAAAVNAAPRCANGTATGAALVGGVWTWQCLGTGSCMNANCSAIYEDTNGHCPNEILSITNSDCSAGTTTGTLCNAGVCCGIFDYCNAATEAIPTASRPTSDLVLCSNGGTSPAGAVDGGGFWNWNCQRQPYPAVCTGANAMTCVSNCTSKHIFNFNFDNWKEVQP